MNRRLWKHIADRYQEYPRGRGEAASDDEINAAEEALGCAFDEDYREFLRRYGSGLVGPDMIFGVRPAPVRPHDWSVVEETRRFRDEGWPGAAEWYVIATDGFGNPIGMDKRGAVWVSDHDRGGIHKVAKSFSGYVKYLLKLSEQE